MGDLRYNVQNGIVDPTRKAMVLQEFEHFRSIAPKRFLGKLFKKGIVGASNKINDLSGGAIQRAYEADADPNLIDENGVQHMSEKQKSKAKTIALVCVICLLPLMMFIGPFLMPIMMFGVIGCFIFYLMSRTPEYKQYNYQQMIAQPALQTIDDKLFMTFMESSADLVNEQMSYDQALVEAHLVKPFGKRCDCTTYSRCTYDWMNRSNPDAFEFMGYRLYDTYQDSDGNSHTVTYFDGTIYKFRTGFNINGDINIMSTQTKKGLLGGEKEKNKYKKIKDRDVSIIDTENHEFAENFDTVAAYDQEAYMYLTPVMIETLLELRKRFNFCICIKGDVMTVTIENTGYGSSTQSVFSSHKPAFAPNSAEEELDSMISGYQKAIKSILELRDKLLPGRENAGFTYNSAATGVNNAQPVYNEQPVYNTQPTYNAQPVYNEQPAGMYDANASYNVGAEPMFDPGAVPTYNGESTY